MRTTAEAKAAGFVIDRAAMGRPWAFKERGGNRTEAEPCLTELEDELVRELERYAEFLAAVDAGKVEMFGVTESGRRVPIAPTSLSRVKGLINKVRTVRDHD